MSSTTSVSAEPAELELLPAPKTGLPAWMDRSEEHKRLMSLPRVRLLRRSGPKSKSYTYYSWDGRPFHGERMLGSNPVVALRKYAQFEALRNGPDALSAMDASERAAKQFRALARESVEIIRLVVAATEPRPKPGVYFLLGAGGDILYVGTSDNVMTRMRGHGEKDFETVKMIHVPDSDARNKLEVRLIHLLTPPLNVKMGSLTKTILEAEDFRSLPRINDAALFNG